MSTLAAHTYVLATARDEHTHERIVAIVLPKETPDTLALRADEARALAKRLFERAAICDLENGVTLT